MVGRKETFRAGKLCPTENFPPSQTYMSYDFPISSFLLSFFISLTFHSIIVLASSRLWSAAVLRFLFFLSFSSIMHDEGIDIVE